MLRPGGTYVILTESDKLWRCNQKKERGLSQASRGSKYMGESSER